MFANRFRCLFLNQDFKFLDDLITGVNLPSITTGVNTQLTSIKDLYFPGNDITISDLIITFQLEKEYKNWKIIIDWMNDNRNFKNTEQKYIFSDISIQLADMKKNMKHDIQLIDTFPYDISEIKFDTKIEDIEPLEFDVIFKVNGIEYKN